MTLPCSVTETPETDSDRVSEERLRECPFCGCDDIGTEKTVTDGSVWCRGCRAKIVVRHAHPRLDSGQAEAIAAWNRPSQTAVEPVWTGPGKEPHEYHPDVAAMGDCSVCGHTYAAHRSSVEPVAELDSLAKLVNYLLGYSGQHDDVDDGFAKLRATLSKEAAARVAAEERAVAAERLTAKSYDKVVEFSARAEALQTRVAELEAAGNQIEPYLAFAIGPESPGYHPTMPSAVASFRATLARRLTHQEKNNGR